VTVRVLHLITSFPESSGAAQNTALTLNLLDRARFEPWVAFGGTGSMAGGLRADIRQVRLRHLDRAMRPWRDLRAAAELVRVIRDSRPALVHTHNAKDGVLGRWAAWLIRVPAIHTIHNVSFAASASRAVNRIYALAERASAPVTARLFAVSRENVRRYQARGIGRAAQYRVVYSGLELERYGRDPRPAAALRAATGLPPADGPWIGWFGRFNHQKDPLTFVRAAHVIHRRNPAIRFVMCGDDPLGASLEADARALATHLGLETAISFLGFRHDLPLLLQAVDLVLHSSVHEGMGRVICEALASGRPVVATAVDGVLEVIQSGVRGGLLVPARNPEALAGAALSLLDDPARARLLAEAGREWVRNNVSAEHMVRTIEREYIEVLASADRSRTREQKRASADRRSSPAGSGVS
jgi:glycosyltransferase involved in cell wall biosynthesis